eukprot:4313880-Prymnesium_polylepis.1
MRPSRKRAARVGRPSSAVDEARTIGRPTRRARSASLGGRLIGYVAYGLWCAVRRYSSAMGLCGASGT